MHLFPSSLHWINFILTANIQIIAGQLAGQIACIDYMQNRQLIQSLQIHYLIIQLTNSNIYHPS